MGAEAAIAIMWRKERDVRDAFHKAGALDPTNSQPLPDIGVEESMALRRLIRHHAVRESSPACFYFDEAVWQEVRAARGKMALMFLAAIVLVGLVGVYAVVANR